MIFPSAYLVAASALAATSAGPPTCGHPSLGLDAGVGIESVSEVELRPAFVGAAIVGWDLRACLDLPLRIEASLGSGSRGPPWWQGVGVVAVRVWHVELAAAVGIGVPFWSTDDDRVEIGVDLLAGAGLRIIGVATRVQDSDEVIHEPRGLGRVLAGLFLRVASWRVQLRVDWLFPIEPAVLVGVGYEL